MVFLVLDIGGTKIKAASLDKKLNFIYVSEIKTHPEKGKKYFLDSVLKIIEEVITSTKKSTKRSFDLLGISMPGIISDGKILFPGQNLPFLKNFRIKDFLEKKVGLKTRIINDADAFTIAESYLGNGQDYNKILGIVIGSGLGSSIVLKTKFGKDILIKGSELGQIKIFDEEEKKTLSLEALVGGRFLEKTYFKKTGKKKTLKEIFYSNDLIAKQLVKKMIKYSAKGISYAINLYGPEIVVLGGGISNLPFLKILKNEISKLVINTYSKTPLRRFSISDDEGLLGIAILLLNDTISME